MSESPDLAQVTAAIVERTNAFRTGESLSALTRNAALDRAAHEFAKYLASSGKFAHEADGRKPADRAKAAGYWYCTIAENLALNLDSRGFAVERLADEAVDGWKKSPGHRQNMLLAHVTETGVGTARAPGPEPKFISVQLLGRPASLRFKFSVANKSQESVSYTFSGQSQTIEPQVTITHETCEPHGIVFERSGNWLTGSKIDARYRARSGAEFVLRNGPDGKVHVELRR